jgi:GDPmannose 4,6-dehydratase
LDYAEFVVRDEAFFRPAECHPLVANPSRARKDLGWKPAVDFKGLVEMMVDADLTELRKTL